MSARAILIGLAFVLSLTACGGSSAPPAADATTDATTDAAAAPAAEAAGEAEPVVPPPAAPADIAPNPDLPALLAAADVNKGKILYLQCRACHSLIPETEPGKIGPTLHGVIGRAAGAVSGFAYSEAIMKSGITWTAEQIDNWLTRPSEFLPGNKMVFVGIQKPQDRADIIAYIQAESAKAAAP